MTDEKKPRKRKPKKVLYMGGGYIIGLQTKDMELKEWNQYPKKLRDKGLRLNLYKME